MILPLLILLYICFRDKMTLGFESVKTYCRQVLHTPGGFLYAPAPDSATHGQHAPNGLQRSWPALDAYSFFPYMTPRLTMNNRNISMTFHIYAVFFLSSTPAAMLKFIQGFQYCIATTKKVIPMGVIESPTF